MISESQDNKMRSSKVDTFGFQKDQAQKQEDEQKLSAEKLKQYNARIEKWRKMIPNIDNLQQKKDKTFKSRIRKGIPQGLRSKVWPLLAKISVLQQQNPQINFETLKNSEDFPYEGDISVDLPRTFPDHQLFAKDSIVNIFNSVQNQNTGLQSLKDILKVLSLTFDKMGYCQGINFLGAAFLIHMNDEKSFWMLYSLMTTYECISMYQNVATIHKQLYVHGQLVKQFLPQLEIQHVYYGVNWYMTLFAGYLPFKLFLRIFDIFLNEGWKIIYRSALAIIQIKSNQFLKYKQMDSVMDSFRSMEDLEAISEDEFIKIANGFIFSKKLIQKHIQDYEKEHDDTPQKENKPAKPRTEGKDIQK